MDDGIAALEVIERKARQAMVDVERRMGQAQNLAEQGKIFIAEADKAEGETVDYDKACALLSTYADKRQESVHAQLEGLVTKGLTTIFQEDLRLVIRTKQVGKRVDTEFRLVTQIDGEALETGIMDSRGGGVAAVAGFLLRVIMLMLTDAPRVLFLDETFAQVSADYELRLADFIDELADELGVQIVLVTHSNAFEDVSDRVYKTSQAAGKTAYTQVK